MQRQSRNTAGFNTTGQVLLGQVAWIDRGKKDATIGFLPIVGPCDPVRVTTTKAAVKGIVPNKGLYSLAIVDGRLLVPPTELLAPASLS